MNLLRDFFKNVFNIRRLSIRYRLLSSGILLGIFAFLNPVFISHHTSLIQFYYSMKTSSWNLLYKLENFNKKLGRNEAWLEHIEKTDLESIDKIVEEIKIEYKEVTADEPGRNEALTKFVNSYQEWKKYVAEAPTQARRDIVQNIQNDSQAIESFIRKQDEISKRKLNRYTNRVKNFSTYAGSLFLLAFIIFIVSLWYTLMPDLTALIEAMKQFKSGNLDHRVAINGKLETAELGEAVNDMAQSIKEQNEKLLELNRLKTDFVSTVSHELRTPLTAIKGSLGLILGGITGPLSPDLNQMLKITESNTDRLIRLINDVLDIARLEAGVVKLKFDKYSLSDVIKSAVVGIDSFAKQHKINFIFEKKDKSPLVVIDRDRIVQVITNLLSNAVKFTEEGGTVKISYEWNDHEVAISVEDSGIGIPEEFMDRIFDKFQQVESSSNKVLEGTGLGLAIVKNLVDEHRGKVTVKSQPGVGSLFTFTIPWNGIDFYDVNKKDGAKKIAA